MIRLQRNMPGQIPSPPLPPASRSLRLRPEIAALDELTEFIEGFAEEHGWAAGDTRAIVLAAEELFANTINHSQPPATWAEFSLADSDGSASATYADDALPFDPTAYPEVDTTLPLDQRPIGGLGIHFIRRTMNHFTYQRLQDRNLIRFGRALTRPATS